MPAIISRIFIRWVIAIVLVGLCLVGTFACSGPRNLSTGRGEPYRSDRAYPWNSREVHREPMTATIPKIPGAQLVKEDELCMTCHEAYVKYHHSNVHREQSCESCHGPGSQHLRTRGEPGTILSFKQMKPAEGSEVCLQCHEQNACAPGAQWRTSAHAHAGVSCIDCHKGHYNVPPGTPATKIAQGSELPKKIQTASFQETKKEAVDPQAIRTASRAMGARDTQTCYRCHPRQAELERVAHPHQIGGKFGFTCQTCHDPHGNISKETRTDKCLECHKGNPTMGWHSSTHAQYGVACADCHNAHPDPDVSQFVDIHHTHVRRPRRLPMSVQEPDVCSKCHPKVAAQFQLPSHHPLIEGKMLCSTCHDAHGTWGNNLKEATVNLVCYKCHADKQGPFVWEHPPVTENCAICHNPHGAVANNLLNQPTPFLCLRCHVGHRKDNRNPDPFFIDGRPNPTGIVIRAGQYTNCTFCHAQIHGSDIPTNSGRGNFFR